MRSYRIERTTQEWNIIRLQILHGNKPIRKSEESSGMTMLDQLVNDIKDMLFFDGSIGSKEPQSLPDNVAPGGQHEARPSRNN